MVTLHAELQKVLCLSYVVMRCTALWLSSRRTMQSVSSTTMCCMCMRFDVGLWHAGSVAIIIKLLSVQQYDHTISTKP